MKYSDREHNETYYAYTLDDYKKDIEILKNLNLPPPQKGAYLAACSKKCKQAIILGWLEKVAIQENLDITPTLAVKISKAWLGRSIARDILNKFFSVDGRTASDKSKDFEHIEPIINKYIDAVQKEIKLADVKMKVIRDKYS